MAEFIVIKGERVEVPADFIEVGRDAVEAFHLTVAWGKVVPTDLLSAGKDETPADTTDAAIEKAKAARAARLDRIAAWEKTVPRPKKETAEASAPAASPSKRKE